MADHGNEHGDASICAALVAAGIDAERALTTIPGLAHLDPRDLRASLTFLEGHFGSSRLGAFVRDHPEALFWSAGAIERLLRNDLGMSDSELARTLRVATFLLAPAAASRGREVVQLLLAELGLTVEEVRGVVLAFPRLLTLSVGSPADAQPRAAALSRIHGPDITSDLLSPLGALPPSSLAREGSGEPGEHASPVQGSGLHARICFLREEGGVETAVLARAVRRHPQLLGLELSTNLRPTVRYYRDAGVQIGRLLTAHPQAFSLSTSANVEPKIAFWREVGVPDVGAMISTHPMLVSLSLEKSLRPKTAFLQALGIRELGRALQAYPQVYTLSLERNIMPTERFLALCGYNVGAELRLRHLAASLARRIVPRHELWRRRRAQLGGWRPSVADLCVLKTATFCLRVGAAPAELLDVERAVGPIVQQLALLNPQALANAFRVEDPSDTLNQAPEARASAYAPARIPL